MAVSFDAKSNVTVGGSVTSLTDSTSMTVGSGANRALVVELVFVNTTTPSAISVIWDHGGSNQSMTLIGTYTTASQASYFETVSLYGLVAPVSGNKTLYISWTTSSVFASMSAVSFSGVDQTGGSTTFYNNSHHDTGGGSQTVVTLTTTAAGTDAAVSVASGFNINSDFSSIAQTEIGVGHNTVGDFGSAYAVGVASVGWSYTLSGAVYALAIMGVAVKSAAGNVYGFTMPFPA